MKKSTVDMQPREILLLDILKSEGDILAGMKQKTRYNIKLAEKKGVKIYDSREEKYIEEFLRLVKIMSQRDKITSHPDAYYRKMFEIIPSEILKLYVAEYEGKIIAANLVLFFGKTATYMHGASDNEHRSVMAPYLLQWQQILEATKAGCERYDFGGVKTCNTKHETCNKNSWQGITKFKTGFSPEAETTKFPGCYDILLKPARYNLYRALQKLKRIF
jgi:lipid II:glycine glycyltransferase (peptidoglycan interpeptide bridge formation enzyme)